MTKYGRGLNREIVSAVNMGIIYEPFSIAQIKEHLESKGWEIPETYINVCLANGSSKKHSLTYKKYFISLGNGKYRIKQDYAGANWK
jgi:uncharacterized protein YbcC (UPF0753/DUF2309 family)